MVEKHICLKLVTGEVIMGLVESVNDEFFNLEEPVNLSYDYDVNGNFSLKFVPYMGFCDQQVFTFNKKYVMMYLNPKQEVVGFYNEFNMSRKLEDDISDLFDISEYLDKSKLN